MQPSRSPFRPWLAAPLLAAGLLSIATTSEARITRIVVDTVESPAYSGQSFGKVGDL